MLIIAAEQNNGVQGDQGQWVYTEPRQVRLAEVASCHRQGTNMRIEVRANVRLVVSSDVASETF